MVTFTLQTDLSHWTPWRPPLVHPSPETRTHSDSPCGGDLDHKLWRPTDKANVMQHSSYSGRKAVVVCIDLQEHLINASGSVVSLRLYETA